MTTICRPVIDEAWSRGDWSGIDPHVSQWVTPTRLVVWWHVRAEPPWRTRISWELGDDMNMGWLKAAGKFLGRGLRAIVARPEGTAAFLRMMTPDSYDPWIQRGLDKIDQIGMLVVQAEQMGARLGLSGAQKLESILAMVGQIVLSSSLVVGKRIIDIERFERGVTKITEGVVDILSSTEEDATMVTPDRDAASPGSDAAEALG